MLSATEAYLALNLLPKVGPIRVRRLLEKFGSPQAILKANVRELRQVPGIGEEMAGHLSHWEDRVDLAEELRRIRDAGISLLTWDDDAYPESLRHIHDPPFLLYVKGRLSPADAASVGVVGSRRSTHYGRDQARRLSFQLAKAGFSIVSGLARGIDTAAHEAALAAGGRTLAVLGSGIGHVYPTENQALADRIAESGAVISEFPVLYVPDKQSFPLRNRIVAGLSQGLLVVEAPAWSGALITANNALEQGRAVFAVPGPIDRPSSEGCHRLIQQGARLVYRVDDVIEELSLGLETLPLEFDAEADPRPSGASPTPSTGATAPARQVPLSDLERRLLDELAEGEASIDHLVEALSAPAGLVSAALLQLEMKRLVQQRPGKSFSKAG